MSHPPIVPGSKFFKEWRGKMHFDTFTGELICIEPYYSDYYDQHAQIVAAVAAQEWRDEARKTLVCSNKLEFNRNADAWIAWRDEQAAHE